MRNQAIEAAFDVGKAAGRSERANKEARERMLTTDPEPHALNSAPRSTGNLPPREHRGSSQPHNNTEIVAEHEKRLAQEAAEKQAQEDKTQAEYEFQKKMKEYGLGLVAAALLLLLLSGLTSLAGDWLKNQPQPTNTPESQNKPQADIPIVEIVQPTIPPIISRPTGKDSDGNWTYGPIKFPKDTHLNGMKTDPDGVRTLFIVPNNQTIK